MSETRIAPLTKDEAQTYEGFCLIEHRGQPSRLTWIEGSDIDRNWELYGTEWRVWAQNSILRNDYPWEEQT